MLVAVATLAAPAALCGAGALIARARTPMTAGLLELAAILGAVTTATALTRIAFSNDTPALQSVGFVETGVHAAIWLVLGLALSARAARGAAPIRRAAGMLLAGAGLLVTAASLAAWLSPWWGIDLTSRPELHPPFGFAAPAAALWVNWFYWRQADRADRARFFFAAAGVATAAWITLELVWRRSAGDSALLPALGAVAFVAAVALNFVPGLPAKLSKKERRIVRRARTLRLVQNPRATAKTKADENAES